ncbi:hypothetical protein [Methylobacterium frigidaeris]|uniref:Uncharacterized protein n=1 Tax=Methylobacterium frigidaeris TaxID=2038277 RepID=A0AA37H8G9_9HYPH|nr:hypothetical protein [Methylobacterium frigidaeris]PIK74717.1 hypothetical protein CS379_01040 [Methylobacterium frigidaeris]GJD60889.1 hypothetical protein MPEAHAMD_1029 [Methylobacterium frigidaeris]
MIDLREYEVPSPQPPASERVHRDSSIEPDADRLASLLAGVTAVRPVDDVVCLHLARRNLVVTARSLAA